MNAHINSGKKTSYNAQSGNAVVIVLVVLVVIAVGALAYLSGQMAGEKNTATAQRPAAEQNAVSTQPEINVEPGNPVVARVNGQEITRVDVFNFIQNLPQNVRQLPVDQLFALAQGQIVNAQVISEKVSEVNLDNDPEVKRRLEELKPGIVRNVFIEQQVEAGITEERMQQAYDQYKANTPDVTEARARHILVEDKAKAMDLITQIQDGASLEELAQEHSIDGTAQNGGELGYFTETEVVPEFAEAVFAMEVGAISDEPIKTQFGFHVVKLEEKRQRPFPELEQVRPFLEGQLRQAVLDNIISTWRSNAEVELLDINGKPLVGAPAETPDAEETAQPAE